MRIINLFYSINENKNRSKLVFYVKNVIDFNSGIVVRPIKK